jgi:hypothetical protein
MVEGFEDQGGVGGGRLYKGRDDNGQGTRVAVFGPTGETLEFVRRLSVRPPD